jgi:Lrp/AsnC family transcriptional regulator for asnA, asnC and gidA
LPLGFADGSACHPAGDGAIITRMSRSAPTLSDEGEGTAVVRGRPSPLDAVSKAIIEQLQQDGRRPYAAIAVAVGLSEAAVRQRVSRLIGSGVVQIVAVTDPLQVGFSRQAMIGIRTEGDLDSVVAQLSAMDEVDYVVVTAGSFDILAEVVCEDDDHLLDLLNHRIRTIDGVRSTESFLYLKLSKQTYTWGTR